jgi:hypothetical protein
VGLLIGLVAFRRRGGSGGSDAGAPPEPTGDSMTTQDAGSPPTEGA